MAIDNFTNTDGTPLATHDSNWLEMRSSLSSPTHPISNAEINNNLLESVSTYDPFSAYYSTSSEDTSQIVFKGGVLTNYNNRFVAVRCSDNSVGYAAYLFGAAGVFTHVYIGKDRAWLATLVSDGTWDATIDHTVKIVASGTSPVSIEVFVDGISVGTKQDTTDPIISGHPGFYADGSSNLADVRFDDWTDGVLSYSAFTDGVVYSDEFACSKVLIQNIDYFDGVDGTLLATHNSNWVEIVATKPITNAEINNNLLEAVSTYKAFSAYYSASNADISQIVFKGGVLTNYNKRFVAVRCSDNNAGYATYLYGDTNTYKYIYLEKNDGWFATLVSDGTWDATIDHTVKIVASGTSPVSIEVFVDGISQGVTYDDSIDPIISGHPGFYADGSSNLADVRFDDWTDGVLSYSAFTDGVVYSDSFICDLLAGDVIIDGIEYGDAFYCSNASTPAIDGIVYSDEFACSKVLIQNIDYFDDIDGTPLATHNSNWTEIVATKPITNAEIRNNLLEAVSTYDPFSAYYSASNADISQIIFVGGALTVHSARQVTVRSDIGVLGYGARLSGAAGVFTHVYVTKNDGWLATLVSDGTWDATIDHTVKIVASGTSPVTIEVFVDGISVGTKQDTTDPIISGHPGLFTNGTSNEADTRFNDWTDTLGGTPVYATVEDGVQYTDTASLPAVISVGGQIWPHIKTFGFTYGNPQEVENLEFIASKLDMLIGMGDFRTKKISEFQYDIVKNINPDILLIPYVVISTFTFDPMWDFMRQWCVDNAYDEEDLYVHYSIDTVVQLRTTEVKTSGTGTPSDWMCDSEGNLINDGESSLYYYSRGFGGVGGTAPTLADSRIYGHWYSGFRPKVSHFSDAFKLSYRAWVLDVLTIKPDVFCDGIMIDTYTSPFDAEGRLINMHTIIELINDGYSVDDQAAREYSASELAFYVGSNLTPYLETQTGKEKIYVIPNWGEVSYVYGLYAFAAVDQFGEGKLTETGIEYLHSPAKTYWFTHDYFKPHYEAMDAGVSLFFNNIDTAWYDAGQVPPIGGKQYMIGSFYLFNTPNSFFALHYGTSANFGPGIYPYIGEDKGGRFWDSHWDVMLEYDIGVPVVRTENDFWDTPNTDRPYLIDYGAVGPWSSVLGRYEPRGRYTIAREYTKALVIVRYEKAFYAELGTEAIVYPLNGKYRRLLENGELGPVITEISLGLAEGAILIKEEVTIPATITDGITYSEFLSCDSVAAQSSFVSDAVKYSDVATGAVFPLKGYFSDAIKYTATVSGSFAPTQHAVTDGIIYNDISLSDYHTIKSGTTDDGFVYGDVCAGVLIFADSGNYWNGLIDEVKIYNKKLTQTEVDMLYAAGASGNIEGSDGGQLFFQGEIGPWDMKERSIDITIQNQFSRWNQRTLSRQTPSCRWRVFGGTECQYTGTETHCDRSYTKCASLGNAINFGGNRWLASIEDKDIWWGQSPSNSGLL